MYLTSRLFSISSKTAMQPRKRFKRVIRFGRNLKFTEIICCKSNNLPLNKS